jgi:hypothetical protein
MENSEFLPYEDDRKILSAYERLGHRVEIIRTRQGNTRVSLDGGRRLCVADAMTRVEDHLIITGQWYAVR